MAKQKKKKQKPAKKNKQAGRSFNSARTSDKKMQENLQGRPTAMGYVENLLELHNLQGILLRKLAKEV